MTVSGCGEDTPDEPAKPTNTKPSQPAPEQTSETADPQAKEKDEVLRSYSGMWTEQMKAYRKADAKGTDLEKYATLKALGRFELDLARMKKAGTVVRGELGHEDTRVTQLDLKAKVPTAKVTDCMDISKWQTYNTKQKKVIPFPDGQPLRYQATASAERWEGRWMITEFTTHGDKKC
ncbi:hypothetical protein QIS99_28260 [Streptomyces sp. B-S-A8]|uniref:Secreted protein/lipoprotein n=1 Tax=Streptomyces solicavernae TaxID=3043614 RepID=A0ABT6S2C7_9ACTN|nr:hypothetical protein [Streptomyces sp. B-S-A8]MDI3390056.1 hypothetical protein [Streptomyces sp. B-S-A8]